MKDNRINSNEFQSLFQLYVLYQNVKVCESVKVVIYILTKHMQYNRQNFDSIKQQHLLNTIYTHTQNSLLCIMALYADVYVCIRQFRCLNRCRSHNIVFCFAWSESWKQKYQNCLFLSSSTSPFEHFDENIYRIWVYLLL